jgi:hypothetical protein
MALLGSVELRYETASVLILRGQLSKTNPVHRTLLRASRDPSAGQGGAGRGGAREGRGPACAWRAASRHLLTALFVPPAR